MNNLPKEEDQIFNSLISGTIDLNKFKYIETRKFADVLVKFIKKLTPEQDKLIAHSFPELIFFSNNYKEHKEHFRKILEKGNLKDCIYFPKINSYICGEHNAYDFFVEDVLKLVHEFNKEKNISVPNLEIEVNKTLFANRESRDFFIALLRTLQKFYKKENFSEMADYCVKIVGKYEEYMAFDIFLCDVISELEIQQQLKILTKSTNIIYHLRESLITKIRIGTNIFKTPVQEGGDKYFMFSIVNLREKYLERFNMTALIGYLYRALEEYKFNNPDVSQPLSKKQKKQKRAILDFLDSQFDFDPNLHVKSALSKNPKDPEKKKPEDWTLDNPETDNAQKKIPPKDVFHRFEFYKDANYDKLREITNNIYDEKPDLDWCIFPYMMYDNLEDCQTFRKKYEKEIPTSIIVAKGWNWTFMGAHEENRNVVDIYTEETEILKKIDDNIREEAKFGRELLKKRVLRGKKKQNEGLEAYKKFRSGFGDMGVKSVDELISADKLDENEIISAKEVGELEDNSAECPEDLIEVNVYELQNKESDRLGENDGFEIKKGKFFTEQETKTTKTALMVQADS